MQTLRSPERAWFEISESEPMHLLGKLSHANCMVCHRVKLLTKLARERSEQISLGFVSGCRKVLGERLDILCLQ